MAIILPSNSRTIGWKIKDRARAGEDLERMERIVLSVVKAEAIVLEPVKPATGLGGSISKPRSEATS